MGSVISTAANGIGSALGNAFIAPVRTVFGASCEGICSGTWDIVCFIEHLCISSLVKLFMVAVLTYIILLFIYLLFQVGIIQCIGRSLCKMTWAACETYWTALGEVSCFLWHKLKNTKRVYRRRFEGMEEGYSSSSDDDSFVENYGSIKVTRKRRSARERRNHRLRKSLYPIRQSSKLRSYGSGSHHHVKLKTREVSVHVKGSRRIGNSRQLHLTNMSHYNGKQLFKRGRRW
ncbi:uncharacterized protein LOC103723523 [Phoenix dactylifera]|uniref:Uncharacterized protein LOC103723523 n=1 Tax=Phoenix dactylifera TaxID=42345 RepID=A0A8B7D3X8_PHODC|nr:uncharacterized protein LOC103723523 [Phoenix dactylifera]